MFSAFFKTESNPTRFDNCLELKEFAKLLALLRTKELELKSAAIKKSPASTDYRKHTIIYKLLDQIDEKIDAFNDLSSYSEDTNEANNIIKFVSEVNEVINFTRNMFNATLSTPRNQQRETTKTVVSCGAYGVIIIAGMALALPTLGKLGVLFFAGPYASQQAIEMTGLDNQLPASMRLLDKMSDTLNSIGENLGLAVNWGHTKSDLVERFPDEFLCIITQCPMQDPYFCILDGITYEKKAIVEWLTRHKNSPYNREEMKNNQTIGDVIYPNRNLKDYIDKFIAAHPQFGNDNAQASSYSM